MLKGIGADPAAFKVIWRYLKKFECGAQLRGAVKDAIKNHNASKAEQDEAMDRLKELEDFDFDF